MQTTPSICPICRNIDSVSFTQGKVSVNPASKYSKWLAIIPAGTKHQGHMPHSPSPQQHPCLWARMDICTERHRPFVHYLDGHSFNWLLCKPMYLLKQSLQGKWETRIASSGRNSGCFGKPTPLTVRYHGSQDLKKAPRSAIAESLLDHTRCIA